MTVHWPKSPPEDDNSTLRGDYTTDRLHEVADEADTVREVANRHRVKFGDAKHDLIQIGRYGEFNSVQDLVEKLRTAGPKREPTYRTRDN